MWRELSIEEDLEEIASLRNMFDCSMHFDVEEMKRQMGYNTDAHYFLYENSDYKILIGFKYHTGLNKITYTAYTIAKFGDIEYYKKAFRIIARKTKEYIKKKGLSLIQDLHGMGKYNRTAIYMGGLKEFLETAKPIYLEEGIIMDIDYKKGWFEMRLRDVYSNSRS